MDALTQQLLNQLSGDGLSKISQQIGADEQATGTALSAAMPMLVSALANNASDPEGAQSLYQALQKDHDGSILGNMSGFLSNPQEADGAGILKHVLGAQQPLAAQGLAQGTGLDSGQIGQLLQIVAPLLMGMLGKQQRQEGLDKSGLSEFLGKQKQVDEQQNPDLMGTLNKMLDRNSDGSSIDEIMGMMGKLFGGR